MDKALNKVYYNLRKERKNDKLFLKNLKKSEIAWLRYRDASLNTMFTCKEGERVWNALVVSIPYNMIRLRLL